MERPAFLPSVALSIGQNGGNRATEVLRQQRPQWRTQRTVAGVRMGIPVEATEESFEADVLSSKVPVLVDFYAEWCGPCKLVAPLMDWAANEYDGKMKVVKIDTGETSVLIKKYGINGLPTLAVFKEGEAYAVTEGAVGKKGLIKYIDENVFGVKAE